MAYNFGPEKKSVVAAPLAFFTGRQSGLGWGVIISIPYYYNRHYMWKPSDQERAMLEDAESIEIATAFVDKDTVISEYRKALVLCEAVYGSNSLGILSKLNTLIVMLLSKDDKQDAVTLSERYYNILKRTFVPRDSAFISALIQRGMAKSAVNDKSGEIEDYYEACSIVDECLSILIQCINASDWLSCDRSAFMKYASKFQQLADSLHQKESEIRDFGRTDIKP